MTWEGRDDDWGADACMEWHGAADVLEASGANETLGERNDLEEMPDYSSWNTVELQRLVVGFGYRASRDRGALVDIAVACWEAGARSSGKGDGDKVKGRGKDKNSKTQDSKDKEKEIPTRPTAPPTPAELDTQFYRMIRDDTAFWTRILRYEPIAFDELISRALLAGISGAGWKDALKRFLDARGVAYYTADPTGPRRRR